MSNFERTEGAQDNLGKNPEFIPLEDLAIDENSQSDEDSEGQDISNGSMIGDHSEDGLEPDAEWEKNIDNMDEKIPEVSAEELDDSDLIQEKFDKEDDEEMKEFLHEKDLSALKGRSQVDRGVKDYDRETIREEDAA